MDKTNKQHALLIGSQILGLHGSHNDVEAMSVYLAERGFEITRCTEGDATRAGILSAYCALIARANQGDAVVVYYAGHGAYAVDPTGHRVQYILPTDWVDADDTFHGILDAELSDLLAKLTAKTTNVTVILDCCHSSLLSRGIEPEAELVVRAVRGRWTRGLETQLAMAPPRAHLLGNPHAVRFVAAEADREAFESDVKVDGKRICRGLFTRALLDVLQEPGSAALSWRGVCNRVREQVITRVPLQRPSVEGPADRTLFMTSEQLRPDAVVFYQAQHQPALRASRLLGARVDFEYDIVRRGAAVLDDTTRVATARITEIRGSSALVALSQEREKPLPGALAFPRKSPFPALATHLTGDDNPDLHGPLSASTLIDLVQDASARFVVETRGAELALTDRGDGLPTSFRQPNDPAGRTLVTRWLERWAKAEALRGLLPGGLAETALEVTWGAASDGKLDLRNPGESFRVGEKLCLYAKNTSQQALYISVIDIGVFGKVTIINGTHHGQRIRPGDRLAVGEDRATPVGLPLMWPGDNVVAPGARRESLMVIAAMEPVNVSVFETPHLVFRSRGHSALEDLLRSLGAGTTRATRGPQADDLYGVKRIDFDLHH